MFNKKPPVIVNVSTQPTEYITRDITVKEQRAPTDASVALLREMEQKARDEIIKSVHVGNTSFECVVHCSRDAMSDSTRWQSIFKLNGKTMVATIETRSHNLVARDCFIALRDEMARVIANEVLNDAFVSAMSAKGVLDQ